jgi:crotonobetainyl-CoA:carnitine CoA-transferase CaiB-like acyl-CoA transferase
MGWTSNVPTGPLAGIRVLDVTSNIAGPCATMILAGLGADVIKIERPGLGDDARRMAPCAGESSAYFAVINRGKRSVALDLGNSEGITIALRLAAECDVFVENFRGGKAEAMGLGEPAVRAQRPDMIYASLSAFGPRGADFEKPGYDALVQARTGIQSVTGEAGTAGARAGVSILDMGAGMWVALGVIAGLFERQRTGVGTRVDGSLYQTGTMWMAYHLVARQMTGIDPRPQGTRHSAFAPYGDFSTADSRLLIGISNDRLFQRLCGALGRPELARDSRFALNPDRVLHREALDRELSLVFPSRTTKEWLAEFDRAGVPASSVQTAGRMLDDPQLSALGQMREIEDWPGVASPILPLEFSGVPAAAGAVPRLGEHTREVLLASGMQPAEIDDLVQRKIVECSRPKNSA